LSESEPVKVYDIYQSLLGESSLAGYPAVIIRLSGCNLRCKYCDTTYAYEEGRELGVEEILDIVEAYNLRRTLVTGGEPLLQQETPRLCRELLDRGYQVIVETNGSLDIRQIPEGAIRVIDIKTPGSGESKRNDWRNIDFLTGTDEIKFVLVDRNDYLWAKGIIEKCRLEYKTKLILSPAWNLLEPAQLASWVLEDKLNLRVGLQLHKIIWSPDKRNA